MNIIEEINESWGWVGLEANEVVNDNDFGNLLIRDTEGQFWRLCPEDVYCEVVAIDDNEFDLLWHNEEFLEDWHMQNLVSQASEVLGKLDEGRKYHLTIPGVLGGEYGTSNICTVPLVEQIRYSGDLGKQIRDLPDGAQIELKVIE